MFQLEKDEKQSLQASLDNLKTELDGIKTATVISESSRQDEIDTLRRHFAEESASMQHIIKGF